MERNYVDFKTFKIYCKRYKKFLKQLEKRNFDPTSQLDRFMKNKMNQEVNYVNKVFDHLKKYDNKLHQIMKMKLLDEKTFDEIGKSSIVKMSKRSIILKYPEKSWGEIYEKVINTTIY